MEQSRSESTFWPLFAAAVVGVIVLAAIRWSLAHAFGIHWDESAYINVVRIDFQRLQTARLIKLVHRILIESVNRPPAYRLLALPFLLPFGFHITLVRLSSLSCFMLSAGFVYLATRRLGSRMASAFATLIFVLSPEVISASIFFSSDAPLFLATSAMLYYLFVSWTDSEQRSSTWIGLGLAIGLGFWSKTSFLLIAPPVLAFALFVNIRKPLGFRGLAPIIKAAVLGSAIAAFWWVVNLRNALDYAQFARSTVRNSLGSPSLRMLAGWISSVFEALLGPGVGILIIVLAIAWFVKAIIRKESILSSFQATAVAACAFAGAPLVIMQLTSTNHLLRYLTPALVPLAIVIGVLVDRTGCMRSMTAIAICILLFCGQLALLIYPVIFPNQRAVAIGLVNGTLPTRTMVHFEQWDWSPLRDISQSCGIPTPKISFLGASRTLNPPAIEYPWVAAETSTRQRDLNIPPDPVWLWMFEDGPPDWQKLMTLAQQSDIVVTAPNYVGEPESDDAADNQYDAELADRLSRGADFQKPVHLEMGRFAPIDVVVFVKNTYVCSSAKDTHTQ
jgi:4-amino-4-deoxy-L-arabinose transferase-like glycosyltransferase